MYLISIYFDEKTERTMQALIDQVAKVSGNTFMLDGRIPQHITLLGIEAKNEQRVVELLEENVNSFVSGAVLFTAIGVLKRQVLYAEPVLNEYLHNMSTGLYNIYKNEPDIKFSPYYKPFGWLPHLSIGKHLNEQQMEVAFKTVLNRFVPVEGMVTRIGIAKTNPHRDIKIYEL